MEDQYTVFRKTVKKRLIDLDQTGEWLCREVAQKTGMYFDSSYLNKILRGIMFPQKFVTAICEILDLSIPQAVSDKQDRG